MLGMQLVAQYEDPGLNSQCRKKEKKFGEITVTSHGFFLWGLDELNVKNVVNDVPYSLFSSTVSL